MNTSQQHSSIKIIKSQPNQKTEFLCPIPRFYQKYHTHGRIVFEQALRNVQNDTTYEHTINVVTTTMFLFVQVFDPNVLKII